MKLYIDSTNNLQTLIRLDSVELKKTYSKPQEQDILGAISELLAKQKANWNDISEIELKSGQGSFTGIRLGAAIANALAFALKLRVNGQNPPLEPIYGAAPKITKPKPKNITDSLPGTDL